MVIKTTENVYHFVKQSIKIKEDAINEDAPKKKKTSTSVQNVDLKNNAVKYDIDYSKFEKCIQLEEEEEEEEKLNKINPHSQNPCSHDHSKERQLYEKNTADKLSASNAFNEEGKRAFYEKNYKLACIFFRKGIIQLDYCFPETEKETEEYTKLEINLHLNMALAKFHMKKYYDCINDCTTVLNLDKNNAKAYYRKGQAYMCLDLYKEAKEYFLKAMDLNANDDNVKKSLLTLKKKVEIYNKRNKNVYSKIFATESEKSEKQAKETINEAEETIKNEDELAGNRNTTTEGNNQKCLVQFDIKEKNNTVESPETNKGAYNNKEQLETSNTFKTKKNEVDQLSKSTIRCRKTYTTKENDFIKNNKKQLNDKLFATYLNKVVILFFFFSIFFSFLFFSRHIDKT